MNNSDLSPKHPFSQIACHSDYHAAHAFKHFADLRSLSDPSRLAGSSSSARHLAGISVTNRTLLQKLRLNLAMTKRAMAKFKRAQG